MSILCNKPNSCFQQVLELTKKYGVLAELFFQVRHTRLLSVMFLFALESWTFVSFVSQLHFKMSQKCNLIQRKMSFY